MSSAPDLDVDRHLSADGPARPRLTAEWRLVITLRDAALIVHVPAASQADAAARGRKCGHSTWHIERRYVSDWKATTVELRSAIVAVDKPPLRREVELDPVEVDGQAADL
jgi:hypothetical protein